MEDDARSVSKLLIAQIGALKREREEKKNADLASTVKEEALCMS